MCKNKIKYIAIKLVKCASLGLGVHQPAPAVKVWFFQAGWVGYSPNLAKLSSCLQTFMEMGLNCLGGGILKEKKWYLMTMFSFTVLFKYVVQNGSLTFTCCCILFHWLELSLCSKVCRNCI
jgi:hypothetical protein